MKFFFLLLLLPVCAFGEDIYHPRELSEQQIVQTYTALLVDACHSAEKSWKTAPFDPAAGYWGDGVSEGNAGIRTIASMALACATLLKYDNALTDSERTNLLAKLTAAMRYATATHVTGTQSCTDGKKWGGTNKPRNQRWQTGMWTGTLATAAWLAWDKLDPSLQKDLRRVITSESDTLLQDQPMNGLWLDTKAEENGWNIPCLVATELMFPDDPHAAAWHAKALEYMMNTLCTAKDLEDTNIVDGRAVNQWVHGVNVQPDFTLENHNIFHPSYVGCSSYFLTQAALYYTYAHRPVPEAATHHLLDTWHMFEGVLLPWGESACPQSMDWELHGLPFINLYAALACRQKDPFAARMESASLQNLRAWQVMSNGDLSIPGSRYGITRHAINAEQVAYGLLAHEVFGPAAKPMTERHALALAEGVREHPQVDFIVHRTEDNFASFSWKNHFMGLIIPLGEGHDGEPFFTAPLANSLTGSFDLDPRGDVKSAVLDHSWKQLPNGFETTGVLSLNGGRLKQTIKVTSLGDKTVVYQDRVTAVSDISVAQEKGVPFAIENDQISGGARTLSYAGGETTFTWQKQQPPFAVPGSWANVDGRLSAVTVEGPSMTYVQGSGYLPGISIGADILYNAFDNHPRQFKAGEEVAHHTEIFYVETSPNETAKLSKAIKIENKPTGRVLRFKLPEGKETEVPLL